MKTRISGGALYAFAFAVALCAATPGWAQEKVGVVTTVVGTLNSGLVISAVIVPLERSGLSVTRTSVFAKFSTAQRVLPSISRPSSVKGISPATSIASLAPVAGSTG